MAIARFRPSLTTAEYAAFVRALLRPNPGAVDRFKRQFGRAALDGQPVVLAPSGRMALFWILRGLQRVGALGEGDEVVLQAFNFPAVALAVQAAGCAVRFGDVRPDNFDLDIEALDGQITVRTRAVVLTHLYGNPARLKQALELCRRRDLVLIEDCAQAVGATFDHRPVGTFGRAALLTFGPTKNFSLLGGGAVSTADHELARAVERLARPNPTVSTATAARLWGKAAAIGLFTAPGVFDLGVFPAIRLLGLSGQDPVHRVMDEPTEPLSAPDRAPVPSASMAAVGLSQLDTYRAMNEARVRNGRGLRRRLAGVEGITLPDSSDGNVFVSFPVLSPDRQGLAASLRRRGVDTDAGFMADCSGLSPFGDRHPPCPHSRRAADQVLHLPVHPGLSERDLDRITRAVRASV